MAAIEVRPEPHWTTTVSRYVNQTSTSRLKMSVMRCRIDCFFTVSEDWEFLNDHCCTDSYGHMTWHKQYQQRMIFLGIRWLPTHTSSGVHFYPIVITLRYLTISPINFMEVKGCTIPTFFLTLVVFKFPFYRTAASCRKSKKSC